MSRPHFYPTPHYGGHPDDLDLAQWDDAILKWCASHYVSRLADPKLTDNEREFYKQHADLTRAEMLARKLAQ